MIAGVLLGCDVSIPDNILFDTFMDYISAHERSVFQKALELVSESASEFSSMVPNLVDILSRLGCRHIPTTVTFETYSLMFLGMNF